MHFLSSWKAIIIQAECNIFFLTTAYFWHWSMLYACFSIRFFVDILFSKHVWNPVTIKRKLRQEAEIDLSGILLYSFPFQKCLYPQPHLLVPSTGDVVLSPFMYTALPSDLTRRREPLHRWHSWIFSFCNITDKVDKKWRLRDLIIVLWRISLKQPAVFNFLQLKETFLPCQI